MNGELLLKGYKFPEKILLNLLDRTVLTGTDSFVAFEIFNMLENYFNRKAFSNYYLDKDTVLILNGNKLSGGEFAVFRLHPVVNLSEELKISKKSILGQVVNVLFPEVNETLPLILDTLQKTVLCPLNSVTEKYGVSFAYDGDDIFTLSKIIQPEVKEAGGKEILPKEHDQFHCKAMILDFISKLEIDKKKLLLIELPEYGLKGNEISDFFNLLSAAPIDNIIVYTSRAEICHVIPRVFNYNVIKNGKLYGFDEYDELEKLLQNALYGSSLSEIEKSVVKYILQPCQHLHTDEFANTIDDFLS